MKRVKEDFCVTRWGLLNISLTWPQKALGEIECSSRREWSKSMPSRRRGSALSPAQTQGRQDPLFHGQDRSPFDGGAYSQYVSANAAKSGKSVSPKVRQTGENAAGGFFQHSHPYSSKCECVPSQNGGFFVCLHPHQATRFFSVSSTSTGECSVPVWDPSQNG